MKKLNAFVTEKRISIAMVGGLLLSILPIIVLAFYNYPCADDFSASDSVRQVWMHTGSFWEVVKAAWENVVYNYWNWSGVFMSVFWTSLQFGIYGEQFYGLTTVITLSLFIFGSFYLGHVIFEKYLKADKYLSTIITVLYVFTSIQCMPDGNEGLYWHPGTANYTWAFAFLLILLGMVLSIYKEDRKIKKVLKTVSACFLAILVGGGNYLSALQGSLWMIVISLLAYMVLNQKKGVLKGSQEVLWGVLPVVFLLISFGSSVLAPGNQVRMGYAEGMGVIKSVLVSFQYCLTMPWEEWFTWPILVLLAMAVPFMWQIAGNSDFSFRYPGIVAFIAFGMISAGFTPNLYAQGNVGDGRIANTIYFIWIFFLYVSVFYFVGWVKKSTHKDDISEKERMTEKSVLAFLGMISFWIVFSVLSVAIREETYIGTLAASSLLSGQAEQYRQENELRLESLYNEEIEDVVFSGFVNPPELLLFQDITNDSEEWMNQVMAEYYGKESVKCE